MAFVKERKVTYQPGDQFGEGLSNAFSVKQCLPSELRNQIWAEMGKSKPHDKAYEIILPCGKTYFTLHTQLNKCLERGWGWNKCSNCDGVAKPCQMDSQLSHTINVEPVRAIEFKSGDIFNDLKLIDFAYNAQRHNYYEFECVNCGAHIYRMTPTNKSDIETCHCPNCNENKYKGEVRVQNYLKDHDIPFKTQFKFADCVYKSMLPFDCAVFNDDDNLTCLIEYDGEQHYKFIKHWHGDEEGFKLQKLRDKIKTDYCASHGIPLIRIPYTEYDNIEKILDASLVV